MSYNQQRVSPEVAGKKKSFMDGLRDMKEGNLTQAALEAAGKTGSVIAVTEGRIPGSAPMLPTATPTQSAPSQISGLGLGAAPASMAMNEEREIPDSAFFRNTGMTPTVDKSLIEGMMNGKGVAAELARQRSLANNNIQEQVSQVFTQPVPQPVVTQNNSVAMATGMATANPSLLGAIPGLVSAPATSGVMEQSSSTPSMLFEQVGKQQLVEEVFNVIKKNHLKEAVMNVLLEELMTEDKITVLLEKNIKRFLTNYLQERKANSNG